MADIFSNPYKNTQTWSAQGAVVTWGTSGSATSSSSTTAAGTGNMPLLMLQLQMVYRRTLQSFYPINNDSGKDALKVNILGAPGGSLTVGSILSPTGTTTLVKFLSDAGKVCKTSTDQVWITIRPFGNISCNSATAGSGSSSTSLTGPTFKMTAVELESVGLNIQGGETAIVNMPTQFSFTALDIS